MNQKKNSCDCLDHPVLVVTNKESIVRCESVKDFYEALKEQKGAFVLELENDVDIGNNDYETEVFQFGEFKKNKNGVIERLS